MDDNPRTTPTDYAALAKTRLANGLHVSDYDVHMLVEEIERLRARVEELEEGALEADMTWREIMEMMP
jgi:hypothetical protein